jgi:phytoene desaturase
VLLEREPAGGGCAAQLTGSGYRIDTGPVVLTMPELLRATFAAAGADMADHVRLVAVDPAYRAVFADGSELRVRPGVDAMAVEIEELAGVREADGFRRFVTWLRALYDVEMPHFIDRNWDSAMDLGRDVGALARLVRLGSLRSMASRVGRFFDDARLRQVFSFQALYAGLSPFEALAVFCIITYMDCVGGVFFAEGGIHAVVGGLVDAVRHGGVDVRLGCEVTRIERAPGGAVTGVIAADGTRVTADAVVVNADLVQTYRSLLGVTAPRALRRARYSPSAVVWVAGTRGSPDAGAAHHNIHFGREWRKAFDALLRDGTLMPDASILVSVPTVTDRSLAPPGCSVVYALEPVPNLDGSVDWEQEGPRLRDDLVHRLGALGYPVDGVELERFVDPPAWAARGLERGTPFSLSHRFFQSGPFRPRNVDPRVPGLVLTGMGTVPGVGIPMVLLSGRLAALRVDELSR